MSDITVNITGLPFDQKAVSGVSFDFSYNSIPCAAIQLVAPYIEENHRDFLCDPDSFKQKTRESFINISVKSKTGCLNFEGVFDGLSFSQSPGSFSYSAIIKSKFQGLLEVYPKLVGLDPESLMIYKRDNGYLNKPNADPTNPFDALRVGGGNQVTVAEKSTIEVYVEMLKYILTSQINLKSNGPESYLKILKLLQDDVYKKNIEKAMSIISEIDISAVKDNKLLAQFSAPWIIQKIVDSPDTMWDAMLSCLDDMGLMILPGVQKLFIIPKANFLKFKGSKPSEYGSISTEPNQAWPANYSNFVISDRGYRNLRACFVIPVTQDAPSKNVNLGSWMSSITGVYPKDGDTDIKDDGSTGILIRGVPPFFQANIHGVLLNNTEIQKNLKKPDEPFAGDKPVKDSNEVMQEIQSNSKRDESAAKKYEELYDHLAKTFFLQEKYQERGGSIQLLFNPKWVPGTTGFVYSRHPSLSYNFFVTSVRHEIALGSGNSGHAQTSVSFNSCRYAGDPGSIPGTDNVDLYKYDEGKMKSIQQKWLSDIGS